MKGTVGCGEVGAFEVVVELGFVVLSYVENEWSQPCVVVGAVLFPVPCCAVCNFDACLGFSDLDGGGIDGGDYGFLVVGF